MRERASQKHNHRFHEVMAQRALMRPVPSLRENGNTQYIRYKRQYWRQNI